jgi:hypothetical protein
MLDKILVEKLKSEKMILPRIKCPVCGKLVEVSNEGWLVDSYYEDKRGRKKREVRYFSWMHIVGHMISNKKQCKGSGQTPKLATAKIGG